MRDGWRKSIFGQRDELPGHAKSVAAQPGMRHDRGTNCAGGFIDKDTAYTAGILHDVGRVALAVIQPKGYAALLDKHHGPAASMLVAEREMFGLDHCEAGRQLIADWKLPQSFEAVVADHHSELRSGQRVESVRRW